MKMIIHTHLCQLQPIELKRMSDYIILSPSFRLKKDQQDKLFSSLVFLKWSVEYR